MVADIKDGQDVIVIHCRCTDAMDHVKRSITSNQSQFAYGRVAHAQLRFNECRPDDNVIAVIAVDTPHTPTSEAIEKDTVAGMAFGIVTLIHEDLGNQIVITRYDLLDVQVASHMTHFSFYWK